MFSSQVYIANTLLLIVTVPSITFQTMSWCLTLPKRHRLPCSLLLLKASSFNDVPLFLRILVQCSYYCMSLQLQTLNSSSVRGAESLHISLLINVFLTVLGFFIERVRPYYVRECWGFYMFQYG